MPIDRNVFCLGIFCNKKYRKKCVRCGIYVCKQCAKLQGNKVYCPDCSLEVWIEKNSKELNNQITRLEKDIERGKNEKIKKTEIGSFAKTS